MGSNRVYIVGASGQVGSALASTRGGREAVMLTSSDVDVRDERSVRDAFGGLARGDVVINTAAYTAVDAAETDREAAHAVNALGPAHLAAVTGASGARLIHLSTDYVFARDDAGSGDAPRPFEPGDVSGEPPTVYGATKLAGERAAREADPRTIVVRTAWVFTGGSADSDFVATMARLEAERDTLRVVDDQVGSPTYARDLAAGLWELAERCDGPNLRDGATLHATNAGTASWCDLARAVFVELGADPARVQACTTAEFPRPAPRPAYSVLSGASWAAAGLTPLRKWTLALHDAIAVRTRTLG